MASEVETFLGIDVGGGSIKASLIDRNGKLYQEEVEPINRLATNQEFLNHLKSLVNKFPDTVKKIGVGTPGPIDFDSGIIIHSSNLSNLSNFPIVAEISRITNKQVMFNNDANCAALGEYHFGNSKGINNLIVIALGTGLGCGWIYQGSIYNGFRGNGMEAGHTTIVKDGAVCGCGNKGCAESYFSTRGLVNRYKEQTGKSISNAKEFFKLIEENDIEAKRILSYAVEVLAELVRNLIHTVNPEKIVFVGGLTRSYSIYEVELKRKLKEIVFPVLWDNLIMEKGIEIAGAYGAASLCF
ncbi:MAG: ROK family protein [Leptospiraceae bacterium]|nr:ROK family protein [Leptospiraceae bacterium]